MILTIPTDEIRRSLKGALAILSNEKDALSHFNISAQGFWNSFQVIVIILIPFGLAALGERHSVIMDQNMALEDFPSAAFFAVKIIGLCLNFVTMPIILWWIADIILIRKEYVSYIVARNWSSVIVNVVFVVPALAEIFGLVSLQMAQFIFILLFVFVLFYHFRIARMTLDKPPAFCVALVFSDFLVSIMIGGLLLGLIAPGPPFQ